MSNHTTNPPPCKEKPRDDISDLNVVTLPLRGFGILGNGVVLVFFALAFRELAQRATQRVSLIAIGSVIAVDLLFLIFDTLYLGFYGTYNEHIAVDFLLKEIVLKVVSTMFHVASSIINAYLAFIRYISLRHPLKTEIFVTERSFYISISTLLIGFILIGTLSYFLFVSFTDCQFNNGTVIRKQIELEELINSKPSIAYRSAMMFGFVAVPAIFTGVLLCFFVVEICRYGRSRVGDGEESRHKEIIYAHLALAAKSVLLNCIGGVATFVLYITRNRAVHLAYGLVYGIHFSTTWILSLFIFPAFRKTIPKLFAKQFHTPSSEPQKVTDQTLFYDSPEFMPD